MTKNYFATVSQYCIIIHLIKKVNSMLNVLHLRNKQGVFSIEEKEFNPFKVIAVEDLSNEVKTSVINKFKSSEYYGAYLCSKLKWVMLAKFARQELVAVKYETYTYYCMTTKEVLDKEIEALTTLTNLQFNSRDDVDNYIHWLIKTNLMFHFNDHPREVPKLVEVLTDTQMTVFVVNWVSFMSYCSKYMIDPCEAYTDVRQADEHCNDA